MACTLAKFATVPIKYAPKRKFLEFAVPQWKNKLGEFSDPDVPRTTFIRIRPSLHGRRMTQH